MFQPTPQTPAMEFMLEDLFYYGKKNRKEERQNDLYVTHASYLNRELERKHIHGDLEFYPALLGREVESVEEQK